MRKTNLTIAKIAGLFALATIGTTSNAVAGIEPYLGEVDVFAFSFCPAGWAPLNGQLLPISENSSLYNLLGTTYGGDGSSTFALPTAKPIFTANGLTLTQCIAIQGTFPPRD